MNKIVLVFGILLLAACSSTSEVIPVELRRVETQKPAPIVPEADALVLRDTKWIILTQENASELLQANPLLFALNPENYSNLENNAIDIRTYLQQQQVIIQTYRDYFNNDTKGR